MANIYLQAVYESFFNRFGVDDGNDEFANDFLVCTNRAVGQINNDADLATQIPFALNIDQEITLDEKYEFAFSDGVTMNLVKQGRQLVGDKKRVPTVRELEARFNEGIDAIQTDLRNTEQETATNDITGLGAPTH